MLLAASNHRPHWGQLKPWGDSCSCITSPKVGMLHPTHTDCRLHSLRLSGFLLFSVLASSSSSLEPHVHSQPYLVLCFAPALGPWSGHPRNWLFSVRRCWKQCHWGQLRLNRLRGAIKVRKSCVIVERTTPVLRRTHLPAITISWLLGQDSQQIEGRQYCPP